MLIGPDVTLSLALEMLISGVVALSLGLEMLIWHARLAPRSLHLV